MQWTLDESRQFQTSDSGYLIRKSVMVLGSETKIECPVYRAFNHTGGFLGASGEKEDAEQLCIQHHKSKATSSDRQSAMPLLPLLRRANGDQLAGCVSVCFRSRCDCQC